MAARNDSPPLKHADSAQEDFSSRDSEKHAAISGPGDVIDHAAERRLVRKLDLHIMPLFFFLYMLCFLDR